MIRTLLHVFVAAQYLADAAPACHAPRGSSMMQVSTDLWRTGNAAEVQERALLVPRVSGETSEPSRLPPIGFVKTHKTGSSTASNILHRLAADRHLHLVFPNKNQLIYWDEMPETVPANHQFDMACNHGVFNETAVRAYLKPNPFIFTVMRKPVAMIDSHFRYVENSHSKTWKKRLAKMADKRAFFMNSISRDLGWYGVDTQHEHRLDDKIFDKDKDPEAIARFIADADKALDFAFVTEHYDEGLVLLRRRLGLTLDEVSYVRIKVSGMPPKEVPPPTQQEQEQLAQYVGVDQHVYEHFLKRFWRQWEEAGGMEVLGPELADLKAKNEELQHACGLEGGKRDKEKCPEYFLMDNPKFTKKLKKQERHDAKLGVLQLWAA